MKNPPKEETESTQPTGNGSIQLSGGQETPAAPGTGVMIGQLAQAQGITPEASTESSTAETNYLSSNIGANLKSNNDPSVVAGGTAGANDASGSKKRKTGGLSSQLGINV